jgi:putative phage-type endonuclease
VTGDNPFETPYSLWLRKTGRGGPKKMNAAMAHGRDMEDTARRCAEKLLDMKFTPKTYVKIPQEFMRVSLDGIDESESVLIEIKAPTSATLRGYGQKNEVPPYYQAQIDYQLLVSNAERAWFFVYYSEDEHYLVPVLRDLEREARVFNAVKDFWEKHILTDIPPPLQEGDYADVSDEAFAESAKRFLELDAAIKPLTEEMEAVKARIKAFTLAQEHRAVKGFGVKASETWRVGSVDYSAIPELSGVDLAKYRKPRSPVFRISGASDA